jgi:DNA-binding LacI/PurR family transcriptional regulator
VLEAADALQFQPSHLARSLRTQTTSTVGFVVPDVSSPFYASALKGAQIALEQAGYRVMLMDCGQSADGEVAALRTLLAHRVDGLLLSTVGIAPDLFEDVVGRRGVPCVFFDSAVSGGGEGTVLLDNVAGIDLLVEHLVAHGHSHLGFLSGSISETSGLERSPPSEALERHGLIRRRDTSRRTLDA